VASDQLHDVAGRVMKVDAGGVPIWKVEPGLAVSGEKLQPLREPLFRAV
jgi:hypothetical protein